MNPNSEHSGTSSEAQAHGKSQGKVVLKIQGLGHVPSVKNGRQLFLMSKKNREWMRQCTDSFVSQCLSKCPTNANGTVTEEWLRYLTHSLPADDNWKVISEGSFKVIRVPKGEEGAIVTIERLNVEQPC